MSEEESYWFYLIKVIHGVDVGFDRVVCGGGNQGVWSKIVGAINNMDESSVVPLSTLKKRLGGGDSIRFWQDIWWGKYAFQFHFPRLFQLDSDLEFI